MKEVWKTEEDKFLALEENLQEEKEKCVKKFKYETNCMQWMLCIKLILYVELALFLGWGCYAIFQTYRFRATENEITDIIRTRYTLISESQDEVHSSAEIPVVFVKPEVISDNGLLENMELIEKQDSIQDKTIVTDVDTANAHYLITMQSGSLRIPSTADSTYNEEFTKSSRPEKENIYSTEHVDEIIGAMKDEELNLQLYINVPFLEKLQSKLQTINEITSDPEKFENKNDFTDNTNYLTNNQENHDALINPSVILRNDDLDILTKPEVEDSVIRKISTSPSIAQDMKQEFSDFTQNVAKCCDRNEEISVNDDNNESVINVYQYLQQFDMPESDENSKRDISSDDVTARNEAGHEVDDNNVSTSTSPDVIASKNDNPYISFNELLINAQNMKDQQSSEIRADIKKGDKYESTENTEDIESGSSQSEMDDNVESWKPDIDHPEWYNPPVNFVNNLQYRIKLESEFNKLWGHKKSSALNCYESILKKYHKEMELASEEHSLKSLFINYLNCLNTKNGEYDKDTNQQLTDELTFNENSGTTIIAMPQEEIHEKEQIHSFDNTNANQEDQIYELNDAQLESIPPFTDCGFGFKYDFSHYFKSDEQQVDKNQNITEGDKYELTENTEDMPESGSSQSEMDDNVESSKSGIDRSEWYIPPANFANDLQYGLKNESESSKLLDKKKVSALNCHDKYTDKELASPWNVHHRSFDSLYNYLNCLNIIYDEHDKDTNEQLTDEKSDSVSDMDSHSKFENIEKIIQNLPGIFPFLDAHKQKLLLLRAKQQVDENQNIKEGDKYDYLDYTYSDYPEDTLDLGSSHLEMYNDNVYTPYIPRFEFSYEDNIRTKRMVDDSTWQQEPVSNKLDEDGVIDTLPDMISKTQDKKKTKNKFRSFLLKMGISSAYIDKLYQQYFHLNKFNGGYVSDKFPMEIKKRLEKGNVL